MWFHFSGFKAEGRKQRAEGRNRFSLCFGCLLPSSFCLQHPQSKIPTFSDGDTISSLLSVQQGQTCVEIRFVHQAHFLVTQAELLGEIVHALAVLTAFAFFKANQVLLDSNVIHSGLFGLLGFQVRGANFRNVWPVHTLILNTLSLENCE